MKKLVNLIALVVLVSMNVFTPFSYAEVESLEVIPENEIKNVVETGETPEYTEEFPENTQDNLGEIEQGNLEDNAPEDVDVQDDFLLQKEDEAIVIQAQSGTIATLLPGQQFNQTIKRLAGQISATYSASNATIQQIIQWSGDIIPSGVTTTGISTSDSEKEIIAWYDSGIIYYYTEAETIYMNSDSSSMFRGMSGLTGLDLSNLNTSNVTNMASMFSDCGGLLDVNMNNWDTSKVTSMSHMFYYCFDLENLDLSSWDTSKVTSMSFMFYYCSSLETVYVGTGFDVSKVNQSSYMFDGNSKLVGGNGTMYDGGERYKNYAKIDRDGQIGYFTDKNMIVVRYMVENEEYESQIRKISEKAIKPEDPIREGANFEKWIDRNGEEYDFNTEIVGYIELIAKFDKGGSAVLLPGIQFNETLKKISGQSGATVNTNNTGIKQILKTENIPEGVDTTRISVNNSENEILARNDGGTIYYYTDANKIYMNPDSSYMFEYMKGLENFDVSDWDTSKVINMQYMFFDCDSLTGLDLSSWNTSKVSNMFYMFYGDNLEYLNLSGWDFRSWGKSFSAREMLYLYNGDSQLKKLDMENTKFGNMSQGYAFEYLTRIEEINLSGADMSNATNMSHMFPSLKNLKKLDLSNWDTSNVTDMNHMFYYCSNLEEIKGINKLNTSKVTDINSMFWSDAKLTGLDLGGWNTSNVTSVSSMFYNCTGLLELNMSGWDFSKLDYYYGHLSDNMSFNSYRAEVPLKKWNMTNTKFSGNMNYAFYGMRNLEELILDGIDTTKVTSMNSLFKQSDKLINLDVSSFDTSNVIDMIDMFYYCTGLINLDMSSFDTSKVTYMDYMFYNTPNLKTIYASDKFVTTALTGNYRSGSNMFYNSVNLVGGNGTKFDSGYIDKTYALIDKVGQTGYFTDKNAINVKFINTLDGTETIATFAKGQKLVPPYVDKYHVAGGYLDEAMTQVIDLNKGVNVYSEIYVKYERNGSSGGGGGGGGGGGSTKPDTPKEEQKPAESPQSDVSTGATVKEPESNTGSNIQTGSQVNPLEQALQNDDSVSSGANVKDPENTTPIDSSTSSQNDTKTYTQEFQEAYEFAHENGITTKDTIQSAQMNGKLTRIAMAKMLSQYAINVLGKEPDVSKGVVKFNDVTSKKDADYDNGVTLAYQLGIMGQNMPGNNFRPNDEVTRAEFATALSRMAYGTSDGEYEATSKYYIHHMERLVKEGIITKDDPNMKELRGYVMIMLMRSAEGG